MLKKYLGLGPTVQSGVGVDVWGNHRAACKFTLEIGFLAIHVDFKVKRSALASLSLCC